MNALGIRFDTQLSHLAFALWGMAQVCAVVSRPGSTKPGEVSQGAYGHVSAVERTAQSWGIAKERILTPQRAGEVRTERGEGGGARPSAHTHTP